MDTPHRGEPVRCAAKSRYLNAAEAVVTHSMDDASELLPASLDAIDRYGIKATAFANTESNSMPRLWPRLREAIEHGHEIGAQSRRHPCRLPDTAYSCFPSLPVTRKWFRTATKKSAANDEIALPGRNDVPILHERHLEHIGGRGDIWYVPLGPLYAYQTLEAQTSVRQLKRKDALARFCVVNQLDNSIYNGSISLELRPISQ